MRRGVIIAVAKALVFLAAPIGGAEMALAGFPEVSELPSRPELPDPLVMFDGSRVVSPEQWTEKRRPELKELFQHYMYGRMPTPATPVSPAFEGEDRDYLGGKATKKLVALTVGPAGTPRIHLLLVIPNKRTGPAPAFLGLNFNGNHTVLADPTIALPTVWMPPGSPGTKDNKATDAGRGKDAAVWSVEKVIDRGYALATILLRRHRPGPPGLRRRRLPVLWP